MNIMKNKQKEESNMVNNYNVASYVFSIDKESYIGTNNNLNAIDGIYNRMWCDYRNTEIWTINTGGLSV